MATSTARRSSSTASSCAHCPTGWRWTPRRAGASSPRWGGTATASWHRTTTRWSTARSRSARTRRSASRRPACRTRWWCGAARVDCEPSWSRTSRAVVRGRGRAVGRAAAPALPLPGLPARQGPGRARARRLHLAGLSPRADLHPQGLGGLPHPGEPRVLPPLEREAAQAPGLRPLRLRERELHPAALGLRGHHLVLRQPPRPPGRPDERLPLPHPARAKASPRWPPPPGGGCRRWRRHRSAPG